MAIKGNNRIEYTERLIEVLNQGETILVPASLKTFRIIPEGEAELLEVYLNYKIEQ